MVKTNLDVNLNHYPVIFSSDIFQQIISTYMFSSDYQHVLNFCSKPQAQNLRFPSNRLKREASDSKPGDFFQDPGWFRSLGKLYEIYPT